MPTDRRSLRTAGRGKRRARPGSHRSAPGGGQHDAHPLFGDNFHQRLEKLASGERVQTGHGLVEEQKLGPFGDCQGQCELGPLAAGERSGPLAGVEAKLLDAMTGHLVVPTRIEIGTQTEVLVHTEPGNTCRPSTGSYARSSASANRQGAWPRASTTAQPSRSGRASSGSSSTATGSPPGPTPWPPSTPGSGDTTTCACTRPSATSRRSSGSSATVSPNSKLHRKVSGWRGEGHLAVRSSDGWRRGWLVPPRPSSGGAGASR